MTNFKVTDLVAKKHPNTGKHLQIGIVIKNQKESIVNIPKKAKIKTLRRVKKLDDAKNETKMTPFSPPKIGDKKDKISI